MRRIWAASSGEYSDYRVRLLFTSEELAQQHVDNVCGADGFVEEFQLWDEPPPAYTVHQRSAVIFADEIRHETRWDFNHHGEPSPSEKMNVEAIRTQARTPGAANDCYRLVVASTDPERLDKVWGERVAKLQAELSEQ